MDRTDFWTLWEKARVGCSERIALKQVYYQGWNRSPAQVGCMRQVLWAGALGRPRGMRWGGRRERGSGWGTHVNPRLIHVNVWQKLLQYCKVISLQLIKINEKKKRKTLVIYWKKKLKKCMYNMVSGDTRESNLIAGSGRFPGEGNGNPLQYSCLENPMDKGAWWATVHGVTKS